MNLYRVAHVYRANKDAAVHERVMHVVAESEARAAAFVNAKDGHEVTGVTVEKPKIHIASLASPQVAAPSPKVSKRPTLEEMLEEEYGINATD